MEAEKRAKLEAEAKEKEAMRQQQEQELKQNVEKEVESIRSGRKITYSCNILFDKT